MSKILNSVTLLDVCNRGKRQLIPWRKFLCSSLLLFSFFLSKSQTEVSESLAITSNKHVALTSQISHINPSVTIVDGSGNDLPGATICSGSSINLYANGDGDQPISYSWTSTPIGFTSSDQNVTVSPSSTTTYTVTVTDVNGLTATDDITVTVNPLSSVDPMTDISYCNKSQASAINFTGPVPGTTFSWISSVDIGF